MRRLILGTNTDTGLLEAIPKDARFRNPYVLGKPAVGKSSLLQRMILRDITQDYAVVLFHSGTLANSLIETIPEEFLPRVRYFSIEKPIPYNPLVRRRNEPERIENELFSLLDQITIQESNTQPLTARMKSVLSPALREVLKQANPTFSS